MCTTERGITDPFCHVSVHQFEWLSESIDQLLYCCLLGFWFDAGGTLRFVSVSLGHMWDTVYFINGNEYSFCTDILKFSVPLPERFIDWIALKSLLRNHRLRKRAQTVLFMRLQQKLVGLIVEEYVDIKIRHVLQDNSVGGHRLRKNYYAFVEILDMLTY